tara:strand:- start:1078 stop:1743 length:666 start_codon:yes stop_codon:yes gene_type:complete
MYIEESRHDFRMRYRTCCIIASHVDYDDEKLIFYVDDIDDAREWITGSIVKENDWHPVRWHVDDCDLDFRFPKLALLNAKKGVVRLTRQLVKQYRQSFSPNLVRIINVNQEIASIFNLAPLSHEDLKRPLFLKDIFFPSYFSVSGAMSRILSGDRYAGAISCDFYLTAHWVAPGIYLGYKDVLVGKMRQDRIYNPTVDLFSGNDDLVELIQSNNITLGGIL